MTITLTRDLEELVNDEIKNGAYESADDVIKAGLRLLKARHQGVEALRKELLLGLEDIQHGRFASFDSDEALESLSEEIISRGEQRLASR